MPELYDFVVSLIRDLGFPAACLLMMYKMCNDSFERQDKQMSMWQDSIDNNTKAINELKEAVKLMGGK